MIDSKPTLVAFETESAGRYNVWRYDTPQTLCVLFNTLAKSTLDAIEQAKAALAKADGKGE